MIWDPVNVSWVQDGQIIVQDTSGTTGGTTTGVPQRTIKDPQPILVQRRPEDVPLSNSVSDQNIGVITQGIVKYFFNKIIFIFLNCKIYKIMKN